MRGATIQFLVFLSMLCAAPRASYADDTQTDAHVVLAKHLFLPAEVTVPAHQKVKLIVTNKDASVAEFKSWDLDRQKMIAANGEIYVYLGPLEAGTYTFYDTLHRETAGGKITVQ